ncbi:MAG: glycosyltransferase, partial [Thermoplasmata archaeon]|nr:glycosyltransferase [Thermoplasmata archaeon]
MKILTVIPLPPGPKGGIEDYVTCVVGGLRKQVEVDVVAPSDASTDSRGGPPPADASLHLIPARRMFRRLLPSGSRSRSGIESLVRGADVVNVHMPCPRLEAWAATASDQAGVPLIATYHMDAIYDGGRTEARPGMSGYLLERLYDSMSARPTLDRAKIIVTNSIQYAKESRLLPSFLGKVRSIHQGVDVTHTQTTDHGARIRRELTGGRGALVTFLGRLVPYKGVRVLIEAAGFLKDDPVTFAIAGRGPLEEELEDDVGRRGLRYRVRFLGFVEDKDVADLLAGSDLVVCPSISLAESTPIVLLEALACGTPIVGTRLGGSEETLPNDGVRGLLVPPRDAKALAAAIRTLIARNSWNATRPPLWSRT